MPTLYKHYKTDQMYEVVDDNVKDCSHTQQQDYAVAAIRVVLFRRVGDPQLYTRTFEEFHSTFKDGPAKGQRRFVPCD